MPRPMKVLIGYDGAASADRAIEDLARAGIPDGSEAIVLTAADLWLLPADEATTQPSGRVPSVVQESRAAAASMLEEADTIAKKGAERVKALFPTWQVTAQTSTDSPAWALVLGADAWEADLIVVGLNRGSSIRGLFMGSVSQLVVSEARCAVRVARGQGAEPARPLRLAVGIDGSSQSDAALRTVAERVWPPNSDVRLIAAVDPRMQSVGSQESADANTANPHDNYAVATVTQIVEDAAATLRRLAPALTVSTFVEVGSPKQIVLQEAERWGADSIFVGARGLNRRARFLLGSVSSAIAARAHCSVEIIRLPLSHPESQAE
ncbi:MAG: universal stress protein [Caldilineaceae bacterium]|nr:universal stress protein [Caldilineaceae bacterium]